MKSFGLLIAAIQGASAFPAVLEAMAANDGLEARASTGCSTSALCNKKITVTDAQIGYNPKAPTAAQSASASRNHCGLLVPCTMFNAAEQKVSVSGANAFKSPAANQIRGPCPGTLLLFRPL